MHSGHTVSLIDTHIHLYAEEFVPERDSLIASALKKGVGTFLLPNIDMDSITGLKELVKMPRNACKGMMGLHPCYVKENYREQLSIIKSELYSGDYVAVGEIGIDLYWDKSTFEIQKTALIEQCGWATELNLPVALHCRESLNETLDIITDLRKYMGLGLRGVFHCFSGNAEQARRAIDMGFMLGIGGVLTFKNSGLAEVISGIDLKHLVLETDGPYLAPAPHRGKRNDPEYLLLVAQKLAELKQTTLSEVALQTSANAITLFNLK